MLLEESLDSIINSRKTLRKSRITESRSKRRFFKKKGFRMSCKPDNLYKRKYDEPWRHDLYEGSGENPSISGLKEAYEEEPKALTYRVKVENLHYELTEDDLNGLFKRIGPVAKLNIKYDRSGRSTGIAFVNFERIEDAHNAINQFNGANAAGQPITLTLDLQPLRKSRRKSDSLFGRISDFKVDAYRHKIFNNYRPYRKLRGEYKTQEDLDNELDKYMNVAIQSSNDTEKPMIIDEK